jgi:hypothetical protein
VVATHPEILTRTRVQTAAPYFSFATHSGDEGHGRFTSLSKKVVPMLPVGRLQRGVVRHVRNTAECQKNLSFQRTVAKGKFQLFVVNIILPYSN